MTARFVDDDERIELLRGHIKVAAECVEAVRISLADGVLKNPEAAVETLDEAIDRLMCAYQDTYGSIDSEKDALQIDSPQS